jgi:hypothetical protein
LVVVDDESTVLLPDRGDDEANGEKGLVLGSVGSASPFPLLTDPNELLDAKKLRDTVDVAVIVVDGAVILEKLKEPGP